MMHTPVTTAETKSDEGSILILALVFSDGRSR